jgi:hypothetical protein
VGAGKQKSKAHLDYVTPRLAGPVFAMINISQENVLLAEEHGPMTADALA